MKDEFRTSYGFAFAVWVSPWLIVLLNMCLTPSFTKTLFATNTALIATAIVFIWETAGCFLLTRGLPEPQTVTTANYFRFKLSPRVLLVLFVFVLPAFVYPMLGPVLITLLEGGVFSPR